MTFELTDALWLLHLLGLSYAPIGAALILRQPNFAPLKLYDANASSSVSAGRLGRPIGQLDGHSI